jgi:peptidoglycan/xylan/chitin deacetylase (PgdA/CDA1 family)
VYRRTLLSGAALGAAGLALGGASYDIRRLGQAARERSACAVADGPGRPLGRREVIWSVPTGAPVVALTFDDGPDPEFTPRILDVLARHGVHATFNVMGYNAIRHADLLRAVVEAGHELGNHTWTHQDLAFQSAAATLRQLERGRRAIEATAGVRPRFFRPPRGELTGAAVHAAAELGHDVLLWSVTRGPGGISTPRAVADHIAGTVAPGDVVALHDGIGRGTFDRGGAAARLLRARRTVEVTALEAAIERVLARGLRFVTASALVDHGSGRGRARPA